MKILLDECLPRRLREDLPGHEVMTVTAMGWAGVKNGALLRLAEDSFDVFITVDRHIEYQQPLSQLGIAIVILTAVSNRHGTLRPLMPDVLVALETIQAGQVMQIGSGRTANP